VRVYLTAGLVSIVICVHERPWSPLSGRAMEHQSLPSFPLLSVKLGVPIASSRYGLFQPARFFRLSPADSRRLLAVFGAEVRRSVGRSRVSANESLQEAHPFVVCRLPSMSVPLSVDRCLSEAGSVPIAPPWWRTKPVLYGVMASLLRESSPAFVWVHYGEIENRASFRGSPCTSRFGPSPENASVRTVYLSSRIAVL